MAKSFCAFGGIGGMMSGVGRLLRLLGIFIIQPDAILSDEVLPEYRLFFDDLEKEYTANVNNDIKDILRITADRKGYRRLRGKDGGLLEDEIKRQFAELLDTHYHRYRTAIQRSQGYTDNAELRSLVRFIKGSGNYDIYFYQMYHIAQDAIYYSLSKLNPQIHEVNKFFIDYFNRRNGIQHDHQKVFNFCYTLRSPDLRGSLMSYVSNNLDTFERSPLFVMFMVPLNLTAFGEKYLPEIISRFADKMKDYENKNGVTIARDCYLKPHVMNERKLIKIIHGLTRAAENELRKKHELPNVGEGWIQETILFHKIQSALPNIDVIHQGCLPWLGNQRLDIWIPGRKAAVEYNGKQHYEAVDFFGGLEGLRKQRELDEQKAALCAENGVRLFIVRYDDDMDEAVLRIGNSV
jgi:hypothetical protein